MTKTTNKVQLPAWSYAQSLLPRTIGFDEIFRSLDSLASRATESVDPFPPFDIVKVSELEWRVKLAVAGYKKENLSIELDENVLTISGATQTESVDELDTHQILYKGISTRKFCKRWTVSEGTKVDSASLEDGILNVKIIKLPVEKSIVKIDIK